MMFVQKKKKFYFLKAFVIIGLISLTIYYADLLSYKKVIISQDGVETIYKTKSQNISSFFEENNIAIRNVDKLNVDKNLPIENNMIIIVERAFPIKLKHNEEIKKVFTTREPLSMVLATNNIIIDENDSVNISMETIVEPNMYIEVKDYTQKLIEKNEVIKFKENIVYSDELKEGEQEIIQAGINGEKIVKYSVTYMNDKETERKKISEEIIKQPKEQIIKKGTIKVFIAPDGKEYKYSEVMNMTASAYNSAEIKGSTGHTYLGWVAKEGIVAVDPNVIPLRTKLYVEGYGEAIAGDTGGAIKGNRIDLYMEDLQAVYAYGLKKNIKVYILKD